MAQPWIADFAELVLIVSGRKPANAQETAFEDVTALASIKNHHVRN
jgi:hypothetical protein